MSLTELIASLMSGPAGTARVVVPDSWLQGRTLFGGANLALAAAVARALDPVGDGFGPLRCAQIAFLAPAAGELELSAEILRQGRAVSFVGVDARAGGRLAARSILTFGQSRESPLTHPSLSAPQVPAPGDCPELTPTPGVSPVFLEHLELRMAGGSALLSGGDPHLLMWTRHRGADGLSPEAAVLAIADVLPPALLALTDRFRPASSITWTVDLAADLPRTSDWFLLESLSEQAAGGYSSQEMRCFDADGTLVAAGRQSVAVF